MASKLLVFIGAGASYDCADSEVASLESNYQPPLVKELFAARGTFNDILKKYPRVEALSDEIRTRLVRDKISLEALLKEFQAETDLGLKKQYWEIPYYLQEIIGTVSTKYVITGATKFVSLVKTIIKSAKFEKVMLATTNYDTFLEQALEKADYTFFNLPSYIEQSRKISLVKLHGSVNWGKEIKNEITMSTSVDGTLALLATDLVVDTQIHLLNGFSSQIDGGMYVGSKLHYYPALSIPVEGKSDFNCHTDHLQVFESFITDCTDFLFIGFSGKDQHILEKFQPIDNIEKIKFVNGSEKSARATLEFFRAYNSKFPVVGQVDEAGHFYPSGFKEFVKTGGLEKFINN